MMGRLGKHCARMVWTSLLCYAPSLVLAAPLTNTWMLLNRATGCEPLSELYADYPMLRGIQQPQKLWAALHRRFPDAVIQPLVTVIAQERQADTNISAEERAFYRPFTKRNAYVISSETHRLEFYLVTKALCDQLMQAPKTN